MAKQAKMDNPWLLSAEVIWKNWKAAQKNYKQFKPNALDHRNEFLDKLALEKSKHNETSFDKEINQLTTISHQHLLAQSVKRLRKKNQKNPTVTETATIPSLVKGQNGNTLQKVEFTKKSEIEQVCMHENIKRFSQSNDPPPHATRSHL